MVTATKQINLNSLILGVLLWVTAWSGKEAYNEIRHTHDAVNAIEAKLPGLVTKAEFDMKMVDVTTRQTYLEARLAAIEIEMGKSKK